MACGAVAAVGAQGLGIAVPALWPAVWLALAGYLFGGVAHGTKNVLARTLIHVRAPARLHGRAFAAFNGLRNGAELVALTLGGVAISELGARWTLLYAGGVPVLAALVGLVWMRARVRGGGGGADRAGAGAGLGLVRAALAQEALELARQQVARRELGRVRRGLLLVGGALEPLDEGLHVRVHLDRAGDLALVVDRAGLELGGVDGDADQRLELAQQRERALRVRHDRDVVRHRGPQRRGGQPGVGRGGLQHADDAGRALVAATR